MFTDAFLLSKAETLRRHRRHWENISTDLETNINSELDLINIRDLKERNLSKEGFAMHIKAACWCCEYVEQHEKVSCSSCPLDWSDRGLLNSNDCLGEKASNALGLYGMFVIVLGRDEIKKAASIARWIAWLPAKEVNE